MATRGTILITTIDYESSTGSYGQITAHLEGGGLFVLIATTASPSAIIVVAPQNLPMGWSSVKAVTRKNDAQLWRGFCKVGEGEGQDKKGILDFANRSWDLLAVVELGFGGGGSGAETCQRMQMWDLLADTEVGFLCAPIGGICWWARSRDCSAGPVMRFVGGLRTGNHLLGRG